MERPSGTVTFLFTDIEGSTRLLGEIGADRYATALQDHRRLVRSAIGRHGGYEVDTQGDSFLVAFQRASDTVRAAEEAQRALAAHSWPSDMPVRVRMGIHTADITRASEGYVGIGVHRGARIAAAAHGGQVLASQATADLLRDDDEVSFRDLGEHRLKDFEEPQRLYQLRIAGLPGDFPPIRAQSLDLTNLTPQITSFIGRERELVELRELAEEHRLVTLIGVGGTGKTRLMTETGRALLDQFADGVWLAELAPIGDSELVPVQVARALGVGEEPGRRPIDTLLDFVDSKSLLLLLDNCEHVIAAAGELGAQLLQRSPSIAILASSREALGLEGEVVFQVASLGMPGPEIPPEPPHTGGAQADCGTWLDRVAASESVRLFAERAKAVMPSFQLTATNARAVLDICRRLDGIPLAIELAAARVNVLSVDEIDAGLGDRFRLLTGGRRGALPRQQTLRALIDWSWDLLSDPDRRLVAQLSVFAASWSLDAATHVVSAADRTAPDRIGVLDGMARLVNRSLVVAEPSEETRYRMLETIRQYARDRLVDMGEAENVRAAHLGYYLELALQAEHPLLGPDMMLWLGRLDRETDELRTALEWGLDADPERAIRLAIALVPFWRARSFGSEAVDAVTRAAAVADSLPPPPNDAVRDRTILLARILAAAAHAEAVWGAGTRAPAYAKRAVALAAETDDLDANAEAVSSEAMAAVFSGHEDEAMRLLDTLIDLAEQRNDPWTVTMAHAGAAVGELALGNLAASERRIARATEAALRSGNPFAIAFATVTRGRIVGWTGRLDEARPWFEQAERAYREIGDVRFELIARSDFGHALRHGGALEEAEAVYRETIRAWQHLGGRGAMANQLESFGFLAVMKGDPTRAARLLGAAENLRRNSGTVMLGPEQVDYDRSLELLRSALDRAELEREWAVGRSLALDDAIAFAVGDPPEPTAKPES
jgi:predicted ATPase/class 3 adenylate cyclase